MKKLFAIMILVLFTLGACNSKKENNDKKVEENTGSQAEKNKATALASVNSLLNGDIDAVVKDGPSDGNVADYGDGSMPPVNGIDSVKAGVKMWRDALSEYKAENMWAIAEGDHVAVFADWSGTFKADFMGMPTNGKSFKMKDCDIFKFNSEGKIIEHRSVQSFGRLLAEMGVTMPH